MNAPPPPNQAPPTRHAPMALWRIAEAFMHILHVLFGAPDEVAERHFITAEAHKQMASWIRCAEAMLRRLLIIEAAAHPKPNTSPLLHRKRQRERKLMYFHADKPEAWRVSFRSFHGTSASKQARRRQNAKRFRSAWPLAERYEAVLRVFANPAPYARRLSRRLHATPHRLSEILHAPPEAEQRVENLAAMGASAESAFCDTS
ncbi:MAG: hypothetical protein ACT4OF_04430 [Caulobacteraceae bacterium]